MEPKCVSQFFPGSLPGIRKLVITEFTANLSLLDVTWQVFRVTFGVYYMCFQREEVGFHVCHLPESF